jgi:hypothetical protein
MEPKQTKGRPSWLPNLFDLIIIALVVVLAVGFLWWRGVLGNSDDSASSTRTLRYTVELTRMYGDSAQLIQVGDTLVDGARKYSLGTVVSVEVGDCMVVTNDYETGTSTSVPLPGYQTATVVLECECTETDTQLTVGGGYVVRAGGTVSVRGPGYAASGSIITIERG